ncbi:hypothetical protein FRC06_011850, partial [Ceratobasidium sp. 370]
MSTSVSAQVAETLTLGNLASVASLTDFIVEHGPHIINHLLPSDDSEQLMELTNQRLKEAKKVICHERDEKIFDEKTAEGFLKDIGELRLANAGVAFRASKITMIETFRSEANLEVEAVDPQPHIQALWAWVERFHINVMTKSQELRKGRSRRWKDEDKLPEDDSGYFGWIRGKFTLFGSKTPQKDAELGALATPSQTTGTPGSNMVHTGEVVIQAGVSPMEVPVGSDTDLCRVGLYIEYKGHRYDLTKPLTMSYEQAKTLLASD